MKSLVTGASGFIGSHIVERLKRHDEDVAALVRRTSNTEFLKTLGVELRYAALDEPEALKKALEGIDRVYHSAALADEWISPEVAYKVNVAGTKNLLEAARQQNVKRFIFVSSLAVLGMRDHHGTPADSPYKKTGDPYIDTKIDSEKLVFDYYKTYGLPATVVRPGFVFGPRDKKLIPRIVEKIANDKFMFVGDGKNMMNIVYIENLTSAIIAAGASEKAIGQAYNVTNDSGMNIESFIFNITDLWRLKRPKKHIPKGLAYLVCNILEGWARLIKATAPPYITKTRIKFLSLNLDFDVKKTREELDWRPHISVEDGLRRTKEWLDKNSLK
ncbi:MAG: NAD-dependent epimerase/dehydratase family protein [Candidatus Omnitrophota bacterium]